MIVLKDIGRFAELPRLSAEIDNYSDLLLVWNPKQKGQIGCYDVEHQVYADLCSLTGCPWRMTFFLL